MEKGRGNRLARRVGVERAVIILDRIAEATMPKAEKDVKKKNAI